MTKPKILVTSAAGRTGGSAVFQLLEKGFSVRAFVRQRDARAEALEKAGAELAFGNLFDFRDLQAALVGVQRAYHCLPLSPNLLEGTMVFALAAEQAKLEVVTLMGGWNDHAAHPAIVSRQHWIAKQLYRWMPTVDVIHLNPGIFAFIYFLGLPTVVHFGRLLGPFGEGLNAPPSNEEIARVAVGTLINPAPHIGKSYRPTGPELLTPYEIAAHFGKILDRTVTYHNVSFHMFAKAANALGYSEFEISQMRYFSEEIRRGAYEIGAPTDHVELVTGHKPESFEQTALRYLHNPSLIDPRLTVGNKLNAVSFIVRMLLARVPDFDQWERNRGQQTLEHPLLAQDSKDWVTTAERQQANLLHPNTDLREVERRAVI